MKKQRLRVDRLWPMLALALALELAVAGCSMGRTGVSRAVTPPDPPPVPRAKPIPAPFASNGSLPADQQARLPQADTPAMTGQKMHRVTEGQSLYAVARIYGVPVRRLIQINRLAPPYKIAIGQQLIVPVPGSQSGTQLVETRVLPGATARSHLVESGDTVFGIARRYGVDMNELVRVNDIGASFAILPGQRLVLPADPKTQLAASGQAVTGAGKLSAAAASVTPTAKATPASLTTFVKPEDARGVPPPDILGPIPNAPPRAGDKFLWPVDGKLVQNYGPKKGGLHNDGINIAAPLGSPVHAAENGVVAYVGNELRGFGNLLLIKHQDGWMTAYAHNEAILVGRGAQVRRGQVVARVGSSGSVLTPQLHFEIRKGTRAVDPSNLLDPRQSAQTM